MVTGAGIVIASFVSGGPSTLNIVRFARTARSAVQTTAVAFLIGTFLMFFLGGIASIYVGGNDIFGLTHPSKPPINMTNYQTIMYLTWRYEMKD